MFLRRAFRRAEALRRRMPAARQKTARPIPIYEMGSGEIGAARGPFHGMKEAHAPAKF